MKAHLLTVLIVLSLISWVVSLNDSAANQSTNNEAIEEAIDDEHQKELHAFERKIRPLRNIFLGMYKNYRSTYLDNRNVTQYNKLLKNNDATQTTSTEGSIAVESSSKRQKKVKVRRRRNKKKRGEALLREDPLIYAQDEYKYEVGNALNVSLDMRKHVVSVNLNEDSLRDVLFNRWNDPSDEGRGKKNEIISKVLPLFILPFLIQSAIIPFLVTKLKLLLIKSILIGKLAIFLLIISALKNSSKSSPTYEVAPSYSYWAGEPSRRSEAAPFNGYRVEGRPTTWIN